MFKTNRDNTGRQAAGNKGNNWRPYSRENLWAEGGWRKARPNRLHLGNAGVLGVRAMQTHQKKALGHKTWTHEQNTLVFSIKLFYLFTQLSCLLSLSINNNIFNTLASWSLVLVVLFTFYCGELKILRRMHYFCGPSVSDIQ